MLPPLLKKQQSLEDVPSLHGIKKTSWLKWKIASHVFLWVTCAESPFATPLGGAVKSPVCRGKANCRWKGGKQEGEEGWDYKTTLQADSLCPKSCQNNGEQTLEWDRRAAVHLGVRAKSGPRWTHYHRNLLESCLPQSFSLGVWLRFIDASSPHLRQQERISWVRREREGARRLRLPVSSVPCGRCLSSSPGAGVDVWLRGSSPHAVRALSYFSKESFHYLILLETFTLRAHVCHPNSCQASMRVPIRFF